MSLRRFAAVSLAVGTLLLGACVGEDDDSSEAPVQSTADPEPMSSGPPDCSEPARDGSAEQRQYAWQQAASELADDPDTTVWIGFNRVLSIAEVEALPGQLIASGLQLVFEQQQGTYVKAQQRFEPVPIGDPQVREQAASILGSATASPSVSLPGIAPNAFAPSDPAVQRGDAPVAGVRVSGDIAALLAADGCLVYSLASGDSPMGPDVSTAIEPPAYPQ
jgi:hypothetical protein